MRGRIIDTLFARMADNPDLFFLTADMGINLVEKIQEAHPDRFANVGIAEQNLIGVASGLCNTGFKPFAYTISNFLIHRCFEQIRDDVAIHEYPVVLLGTGAGFDNPPLGPTHHIIDDWGPLRNIPGVDVYAPGCVKYCDNIVDRLVAEGKPAYVRIAKGGLDIPGEPGDVVVMEGQQKKNLLISYGTVFEQCQKVLEMRDDTSAVLVNKLIPLDEDTIARTVKEYDRIVVVEDHFAHTGLYSMLCQLAVERGLTCKIESRAPHASYGLVIGTSNAYYLKKFGMDADSLNAMLG